MKRLVGSTNDTFYFTLIIDGEDRNGYMGPILKSINEGLVEDGRSIAFLGYAYDTNIVTPGTNPDFSHYSHNPVNGEVYDFSHQGIFTASLYNAKTKEKVDVKGKVIKIIKTENSRDWGSDQLSFEIVG